LDEKVLYPDWQDVKMAGAILLYQANYIGQVLHFVSHHEGHIAGGDETGLLEIIVYGWTIEDLKNQIAAVEAQDNR
jgi:hypothetical protein